MAQPSKSKLPKIVFVGDEHILYKQENVFDTIITSANLNVTLQEAKTIAITNQDPYHLWDSNLAREVCPRFIYFLEFYYLVL